MNKVIICGCFGKMGQAIVETACEYKESISIVGGMDKTIIHKRFGCEDFPIFNTPEQINIDFDTIIDFSSPAALLENLKILLQKKKSYVIGTTGFDSTEEEKISQASKTIPIVKSSNMSLIINLICCLSQKTKEILKENNSKFDIEIIEKHHAKKIDAPSGTALMLAKSVSEKDTEFVFDRSKKKSERDANEIGISSIRCGDICGEHEIIFACQGETFTMTHNSGSRKIFARGALNAALFLENKSPKIYNMKDVLGLDIG